MHQKYDRIWSGHLGHIVLTTNCVDIVLDGKLAWRKPHRAGPIARSYIFGGVQRLHEADVIEPTQCEAAAPVVCAPGPDKTHASSLIIGNETQCYLRICTHYRKWMIIWTP